MVQQSMTLFFLIRKVIIIGRPPLMPAIVAPRGSLTSMMVATSTLAGVAIFMCVLFAVDSDLAFLAF
jgi:hypothetical protein